MSEIEEFIPLLRAFSIAGFSRATGYRFIKRGIFCAVYRCDELSNRKYVKKSELQQFMSERYRETPVVPMALNQTVD